MLCDYMGTLKSVYVISCFMEAERDYRSKGTRSSSRFAAIVYLRSLNFNKISMVLVFSEQDLLLVKDVFGTHDYQEDHLSSVAENRPQSTIEKPHPFEDPRNRTPFLQ